MKIQFQRTGKRRYSIVVMRPGKEDLRMDSAPGFDERMPHDLQHLIVEQELRIKLGIFGQLAVGGTAGTFHQMGMNPSSRNHRSVKKRGAIIKNVGHDDSMFSERATYICWHHWLRSIGDPSAKDMEDQALSIMNISPSVEKRRYTKELFMRTDARMSEWSRKWQSLGIGEHLEVDW